MADSFKCHVDRPGQALVVLRHDEIVMCGAERDGGNRQACLAEVFQPPRAGLHFPGVLSDADARQPLPECGEAIVISRSTRSLPWRAR